ncbi:MAG: GNAT family N-acetyltransferase [Ruminococcus sp.]|nr:GNAT family N-acetyltransferase [Ruminococcus sp.]MCD7800258.1 GNAT family N-acetyltransferase [Ruminococcus sp.]
MNIQYRKLTINDLDTIIDMRINQLQEEGAKSTFDLRPQLLQYYTKHLQDNTFISYVATYNGKIIATSGISFVEKPPYYNNPTGKIGLLSSMYTLKEYRRMGIAKKLLGMIVNIAKEYGCGTIHITASDMGVLLYTNFGFKKNGNFMQYNFY